MDNSFFGHDPFLVAMAIIFFGSIIFGIYINFFNELDDSEKPINYFLVFFILISGHSLFF